MEPGSGPVPLRMSLQATFDSYMMKADSITLKRGTNKDGRF